MNTKAIIALIFVSIVWGTTYLGIKIGVAYFPPFLFAGSRQLISGLFMIVMAMFVKHKWNISWRNILFQSFIGFLMITLGNGFVTMGEQWVNSGVAALICSLMPLIAVGINLMLNKDEKVNTPIVLGMLLALGGVLIIFKDNLEFLENRNFIFGVVLIAIATSSWAVGSVLNRRKNEQSNAIFNSAIQVTSGGVFLLLISLGSNETVSLKTIPAVAWWNLIYLIVFGSVLAYTAYMYMLKHLPVGLATSYAYINPLVAVFMGWAWANEPLTIYTLLAFTCIVGGVYLVNYGYKKYKRQMVSA